MADGRGVVRPLFGLGLAAVLGACGQPSVPEHQRVVGGIASAGLALMVARGCYACHDIPGIDRPDGTVGPSLGDFGRRAYIAGVLPNRPAMLTAWLQDPPAVDPQTAMPAQGVTVEEARHMAAYLYTLR